MFLCGRYEGYDERIRDGLASSAGGYEEISLGDFVLAGGELPAMVVLEAAVRLIPGVLGCAESTQLESFETEWLDYPQYTRPREFRGMAVPDVLLSGHHANIGTWRTLESLRLTRERRPDLLASHPLTDAEQALLNPPLRKKRRPRAGSTPP